MYSVPSGSDAGLDDQPSTSKRETKKSRRPKAAPRSGKKRKAPDGSEVAGEAEEEGNQAAELYCVCRQPDDSDREFIECDSCSQWYHPDCVGISLQVRGNLPSGHAIRLIACPECLAVSS